MSLISEYKEEHRKRKEEREQRHRERGHHVSIHSNVNVCIFEFLRNGFDYIDPLAGIFLLFRRRNRSTIVNTESIEGKRSDIIVLTESWLRGTNPKTEGTKREKTQKTNTGREGTNMKLTWKGNTKRESTGRKTITETRDHHLARVMRGMWLVCV